MIKKAENTLAERFGLLHIGQVCRLAEYHELTPRNGSVKVSRLRRWCGLVQRASKDERRNVDRSQSLSQVRVAQGGTCSYVPRRIGRLDHLSDLSHHLGMPVTKSLAEEAREDSVPYGTHAARTDRVNTRIPYLCCTDSRSGIREHSARNAVGIL